MAGMLDGHNIEVDSIPSDRLIDTFVLESVYTAKMTLLDNTDTSLQTQITNNDTDITALQNTKADQTDLDTHIATNIGSAHTGELHGSRITNASIIYSKIQPTPASSAELQAHINTEISTAHDGVINPVNQFTDRTIPFIKLEDDVPTNDDFLAHINDTTIHYTLDPTLTNPNKAAPANHVHPGGGVSPHHATHNYLASDALEGLFNINTLGWAKSSYYDA